MDTPELPLATQVGYEFVKKYYIIMKDLPEMLPDFYKDNSVITRIGHDGTIRNSSLSDMRESLNTLSSGGFDSVVVSNSISHACAGGSIMVIVNGYFILKESVEQNFSQTFLLAPQDLPKDAPQEKGYFVFSDFFVFLEKPKGTKIVSGEDSKASIPPANNETVVARSEVAVEELKDVSELSYASVVIKETPKNPSPRREVAAVVDRGDNNNQKSRGVFLRDLAPNTKNTTIQNAFQQFGEVYKVVDRVHHSHRLVLFTEEAAVQKAIEASPIMINGSQVTVQILRPTWELVGGIRGQGPQVWKKKNQN